MPRPHLVRCTGWSDGGNEFIFSDGVVIAFTSQMESMVVDYPTGRPQEHVLTHLCLSHHQVYLDVALEVFNALSPQPRMLGVPTLSAINFEGRRRHIDSLILSEDPKLFSIVEIAEDARRSITLGVQSCALGVVKLILHPTRDVFTVRWPLYMSGVVTETEQMFSCSSPPTIWAKMLEIAQHHDLEHRSTGTSRVNDDNESTFVLPLPSALGFSSHSSIRFSSLSGDDASALRVGSGAHALRCAKKLHSPTAFLLWLVEGTEFETGPVNVYWSQPNHLTPVVCYSIEDLSSFRFEITAEESFSIAHNTLLGSATYRASQRFGDTEVIYPSNVYSKNTSESVEALLQDVLSVKAHLKGSLRFADGRTHRNCLSVGKYLPSVIAVGLSLAKHQLLQQRAKEHEPTRVCPTGGIICSSRVPGVGIFTAYTSNVVRCVFDDRTIGTLSFAFPEIDRSRLDLVCPDGTRLSSYSCSVTPDHAFWGHFVYLKEFWTFAQNQSSEAKVAICSSLR